MVESRNAAVIRFRQSSPPTAVQFETGTSVLMNISTSTLEKKNLAELLIYIFCNLAVHIRRITVIKNKKAASKQLINA